MDVDKFFERTKRKTVQFDVPGFGPVTLQALTLQQRLSLRDAVEADEGAATTWMICECVVGLTHDDAERVDEMDADITAALVSAITNLTDVGTLPEDEAKNV